MKWIFGMSRAVRDFSFAIVFTHLFCVYFNVEELTVHCVSRKTSFLLIFHIYLDVSMTLIFDIGGEYSSIIFGWYNTCGQVIIFMNFIRFEIMI